MATSETTATTVVTTTDGTTSPDDNDSESGSGSSSGGDPDPLDGLCPSAVHDCDGEAWKIAPCEGCDELSPVGECVLDALSDQAGSMFTTLRCAPECIRDRYIVRPGGPEVMVESQLLNGEGETIEIVDRKMCTRVAPSYFTGCLTDYSAECADPETWFSTCADFEATECPFFKPPG
jgi:hypothetical protein